MRRQLPLLLSLPSSATLPRRKHTLLLFIILYSSTGNVVGFAAVCFFDIARETIQMKISLCPLQNLLPFLSVLFFFNFLSAQETQSPLDSLDRAFRTAVADEDRFAAAGALLSEFTYVDIEKSYAWLDTMRHIAAQLATDKYNGRVLLAEAYLASISGEYKEAKQTALQGLKLAEQAADAESVSEGCSVLANILMSRGNYDAALEYLLRGLKIAEAEELPEKKAVLENGISRLHYDLGRYDKAIAYAERTLAYFTAEKNWSEVVSTHYMIASTYRKTGDTEKSEENFLTALETAEKHGIRDAVPFIYNGLTALYSDLGEHQKAVDYSLKSLPIFQAQNNRHGEFSAMYAVGNEYISLGKPEKALPYLNRALPIAEATNDAKGISRVRQTLSSAYRETGNYRPAYENLREAFLLEDTIYSAESAARLAEAETKYETEKVQKDLELSEQKAAVQAAEIQLQRNRFWWLAVVALLSLLLIIGLILTLRARKRKNDLIAKQSKEKEILLRELHHRVKNNLSVISGILSLQSYKTEDAAAKKAITDSRTRVESMSLIHQKLYQKENLTSIEIQSYIEELSDMIFDAYGYDRDSAALILDVEKMQVDVETAIPLGLIINEIISNTFKHGFPEGVKKPEVKIVLAEKDKKLHLNLSDNGVGLPGDFIIPTDNPRNAKSFGTQLLSSLAKQLDAKLTVGRGPGSSFDFLIENYKLGA